MKKIVNEYFVYDFNELSDNAKEYAIEKYNDINTDGYEWWIDELIDFSDEIETNGIEIDYKDIYFSIAYSQSDYLYFDKGSVDGIKYIESFKTFSTMDKYQKLAEFYQKNDGNLSFSIIGNSYRKRHYVEFSGDNFFDLIDDIDDNEYKEMEMLINELEKDIDEYINEIAGNLHKKLYRVYEYLTSDDAIIETFLANEYTFLENGVMDNS